MDTNKQKLSWWKFQMQDGIWLFLFAVGFVGMVAVLYCNFFIEPFYWWDITDNFGFNSIWVAIIILGYMMISIGYKIFYKGWKDYLKDPKA